MKYNSIFLLLISLFTLSCSETEQADLLVHNAKIYTVNSLFDVAGAMVIKDGKIIAIGDEHEILNKYTAKNAVDAKKRPIYPGFIDAHCHFVGYALNLKQVDLVGTTSFEEVISRVVDFSKKNNNEWIIGRGWDQNDWEVKEFPTKEKLDSLFPHQPIFLTRVDGHAALVNGEALRRANVTNQTKVDGGIVMLNMGSKQDKLRDLTLNESGNKGYEPTGILIDNAVDLVSKVIPQPSSKELTEALLFAQNKLFEVGVTTVDDAGLTKDTINLIDQLQQEGKLKIKVYAMISAFKDQLAYYLEKGPYQTDRLNVRSFKFYADGALGSRGAYLKAPYADVYKQAHYGLMVTETATLEKYAPLLNERGFQMNTHCIGDAANQIVLDIYGATLKSTNDKRWRIEHAQVIAPEDFEKFRMYNVIPSVQPTHATSDMYWAEDRLGEERVKGAYAFKDLLNLNGLLALGTDFPVEGINPMTTFYAAVVRKDAKGFPNHGYQKENALSREEALKGMTIWAAISNFEENEKGSLEVGKSADFVILNDDIMETKEEELLNVKVLQTFINGEMVFKAK
ncbi:MAG: amidohydrolase [Vicingus serpentipes]|nr:amidohydrolase [Vicingus serpentipes]